MLVEEVLVEVTSPEVGGHGPPSPGHVDVGGHRRGGHGSRGRRSPVEEVGGPEVLVEEVLVEVTSPEVGGHGPPSPGHL